MRKNRITRRSFILLAGATGIGAILLTPKKRLEYAAQKLIPFINPPDYPKPGEWAFYSTTCRECPAGCGMIVWHRDGRITKAEGNPFHPLNKGKLCIRGQSSVQGEYDPDRLSRVLRKNDSGAFDQSSWDSAFTQIRNELGSKKLILISGLETGSLSEVMNQFAGKYGTRPVWYEAFNYESLRIANKETYGAELIPRYDISGSDLIVSFGADFLQTWLSPVEYAIEYSNIHSAESKEDARFIYVGHSETLTAADSDEFIITQPGTDSAIIYAIISKLRQKGVIKNSDYDNLIRSAETAEDIIKTADKISDQIASARSPLILAGRPLANNKDDINTVKAAALLNELLGNSGRIDFFRNHALGKTVYKNELAEILRSVSKDNIIILCNTNPAYSFAGSSDLIRKAGSVIYIGNSLNETAEIADWILPANYPFEEWGDYEPWKGIVSLIQPVMKPLYDTKSSGDILLRIMDESNPDGSFRKIVNDNWRRWLAETGSESELSEEMRFRKMIRESHLITKPEEANTEFTGKLSTPQGTQGKAEDEFYIDIIPSLFFYDGRLSNRPWLQEIPDPVTNLVWQSWLNMNSGTASKKSIKDGDVVRVTSPSGMIEVPVRLTDLLAADTVSVETGQGHTSLGRIAKGTGVNPFLLAGADGRYSLIPVKIEKAGKEDLMLYLNATQEQHERNILRYIEHKGANEREKITMPLPEGYNKYQDMYSGHPHKGHRWAMAIDLQRCIGCKACESACYAENNIPAVGRNSCRKGLEMSWLKVVPYRTTGNKIAFLPLPCQHCDAAPCEPVCPVYASSHTEEGLNAQIYNRCVGTRYCSNNCPYKVRRFNWKNIDHSFPASLQLNPEVTVRVRGVMEKCTFCVQRIRSAEYTAIREKRTLKDGDIIPACAQTCPTNAIIFGDLLDKNSLVSILFENERRYQLLHELNTKPGVVYLKKIIK